MSSHECPVAICTKAVSAGMLMCRAHWYAVPRPLRTAVWNAWVHGTGAGSPAHQDAIRAAIEAVDRKLGDAR